MVFRRLALALISLGVLIFPLTRLYCAGDDRAAMACCKENPDGCNRGGKADDCCTTVPNDGSPSGPAVKSIDAGTPTHVVAVMPASASIALDRIASAGHQRLFAPGHVPLDLPPPLLSTLRI